MQYDLVIKALILSCNVFAKRNVIASARTVGTGGAGFSSEPQRVYVLLILVMNLMSSIATFSGAKKASSFIAILNILFPRLVRASSSKSSVRRSRASTIFDVQSQPLKIATAQWIVQALKKNR